MNGFTRTRETRVRGRDRLLWLGMRLCSEHVFGRGIADQTASRFATKHEVRPSRGSAIRGRHTCWPGPRCGRRLLILSLTPDVRAAMWKSIGSDPPRRPTAWCPVLPLETEPRPGRFAHYHPHVAPVLDQDLDGEPGNSDRSTPRQRHRRLRPRPAHAAADARRPTVPEPGPCCWRSA